ncbi:MAG: arginine--tRNA ligase [bacterium]|nr:arginine--tRNA ligase [bacterium]
MISIEIKQNIKKTIMDLYSIELDDSQFQVDAPSVPGFGDYTSNCAMIVVKMLPQEHKQSPINIAKNIADLLSKGDKQGMFSSIQAAHPGFINLTLSLSYLNKFMNSSLLNDLELLKSHNNNTKTTLIEFLSPNTNKPLHIGHTRNALLGQAFVNLQKIVGNRVTSANLYNDRGIHIIKSMYGYLMHGSLEEKVFSSSIEALDRWDENPQEWKTPKLLSLKPDHFVGQYYLLGNTEYDKAEEEENKSGTIDESSAKSQMQRMLVSWEGNDLKIRKLWKLMNDWAYLGINQTLDVFGIKSPNDANLTFDLFWYESNIYNKGKDTILANINNGVIIEDVDGHVYANLSTYNLPDIVLLRKNKTTLYIIQDIEMLRERILDFQFDKVIYLTANEQDLRFKQLFAICESLHIGNNSQFKHIGYGTIRRPEGKMSSRSGNVILADDLLDEVTTHAREKLNTERIDYSEEDKSKISTEVALAAIKYGILKYNAMSNITFDIEKNISFDGDTGPYLQYTHARTCSLLRKNGGTVHKNSHYDKIDLDLLADELSVARILSKYSEVLSISASSYNPNYLCEYLFSLAQTFNQLYANKQILSENNSDLRGIRIQLTHKTKDTLSSGLNILGIVPPEKM